MQKIDQDKIVILDFGSQYTQLIARRIREIGVLSEIVSCEISPKELLKLNPRGIIFSGGPESVNSKFKPKFNPKILEINQPILGICYGMQLLANQYKGKVDLSAKREFGHSELAFNKNIDYSVIEIESLEHFKEKKIVVAKNLIESLISQSIN